MRLGNSFLGVRVARKVSERAPVVLVDFFLRVVHAFHLLSTAFIFEPVDFFFKGDLVDFFTKVCLDPRDKRMEPSGTRLDL
jgi:hypothetical protein